MLTLAPSIAIGFLCGLFISWVLRPEPRHATRQSEQLDPQDARCAYLGKLYKGLLPTHMSYSEWMDWCPPQELITSENADELFRDR